MLFPKAAESEKLCLDLGFSQTVFGEGIALIHEKDTKRLFVSLQQAKQKSKLVLVRPSTEDQLRQVLERPGADIILGVEQLHHQDSLHYLRSGLDQIFCTIAAQRGKTLGFSFADILQDSRRPRLLARMTANIRICKKYNVKMFFGNFSFSSGELRSKSDLQVLFKLLGG